MNIALEFFITFHLKKYPNSKLQKYIDECGIHPNLLDLFVFKKVKSKALISLKNLVNNNWNFELLDYIPTPIEVLAFQAKGIRPVTLIYQKELKPILTREDCLEFFLHDLEHGHMFFFDEELKHMQINFFKKVHASLQTPIWNSYLENHAFKEKFHYLISDMNSHKEHYRQYLNSILPIAETSKFDFLFEGSDHE